MSSDGHEKAWIAYRVHESFGKSVQQVSIHRDVIEQDLRSVGYRQSSQPRLWIRDVGDVVHVLPADVLYVIPE